MLIWTLVFLSGDLWLRWTLYHMPGIRRYRIGAYINRGGRSALWLSNCDKFKAQTNWHSLEHIRNLQQTNRRRGWLSATYTDLWTRVIARTIPNLSQAEQEKEIFLLRGRIYFKRRFIHLLVSKSTLTWANIKWSWRKKSAFDEIKRKWTEGCHSVGATSGKILANNLN